MTTFDGKTLKCRARRPRETFRLLENKIEERERGTIHWRPAQLRDLVGDEIIEVTFDGVVGFLLRG